MKRSRQSGLSAVALFAVAVPVISIAQQPPSTFQGPGVEGVSYTIVDLGAVGPLGQPFMISDDGFIAGLTATQKGAYNATLWFYSSELYIGTLGGTNSIAQGVNDCGVAVGGSQTSASSPENANSEDFCGFNALGYPASSTTCLPFVWRYGSTYALPTLGGPNGQAYMINNRGDVVGYAENLKKDTGCPVHQFQPVVWKDGKPNVLCTPGESYGVAAYVNEKGQVSGASGACGSTFNTDTGTYLLENHPMFWDADGTPHELQTLGGSGDIDGNHACALNNRGQAVGHSETPNSATFLAVLWPEPTRAPVNLGTLKDDVASLALSINDDTRIVGASFDANFNPSAIVWKDGVMTDLNTLIHGSSSLYLLVAYSINNRGQITGYGVTESGEIRGFLALPSDHDPDNDAAVAIPRPALSALAHQTFRRLLAQQHAGFSR